MTIAATANSSGRIGIPWNALVGPAATLVMGIVGAYLGIRIAIADIRADIKIERSERIADVRRLDGRLDGLAGRRARREEIAE